MQKITLTSETFTKKLGFKNAYKLIDTEVKEITEKEHSNITNDDACKWFRRLGGSETKTMGYTCNGYKCIKLVSTSPDKETKKIRNFKFTYTN